MKRILLTSTRSWAGKTTLALGLALNCEGACAYMKPLRDNLGDGDGGDDADAVLMSDVTGAPGARAHLPLPPIFDQSLAENPPGDPASLLDEAAVKAEEGREGPLFVEGGPNFSFGMSAGLDAASTARHLGASVVIVADGSISLILDKLALCREYFGAAGVDVAGYVVNKVEPGAAESVAQTVRRSLEGSNMPLLGVLPREPLLARYSMEQVLGELNGKLLAGESGLDRTVGKVLVGAMGVETTVKHPLFHTPDKLLITGGDRIDMQVAGLETSMAGMVLTGGAFPDPKVVSMADDRGVPLILVRPDTFTIVSQVERMKARVDPEDGKKLELIKRLVGDNIDAAGML